MGPLPCRCLLIPAVVALGVLPASADRVRDALGPSTQAAAPSQAAASGRLVVRALTAAGQPVTDLKAEELTVKVDGRDRTVTSLDLVAAGTGASSAAGASPAAPAAPVSTLPPPFSTNAAPPAVSGGGREFLIILDEEGIGLGREAPVRQAIMQLAKGASPADRFSLISLRQGGLESSMGAPAALVDTVARFVGLGSQNESAGEMVCRSQRAMHTLTGALRGSPAGRTIVLVSPGLPATPSGVQPMRSGTGTAGQAPFSDVCQIRSNDFDQLTAAAAASAANVYVLHYAEGLAAASNVSVAQQGLENITGSIDGELIRLGSGKDAGLARLLTETSSYYIATLEGADAPIRRIDVRTTREDTKVTARPAGRAGGKAAAGAPPKAGSPDDMIRVAAMLREVPLRAHGMVSRLPGSQDLMVMALFEPEDPAVTLKAAVVALFDEKGTLKAKWSAKPSELASYPVAAAVPIAPGSYRMRVAVSDESGKGGTTDSSIHVQLAGGGPVKLGSMVIGTDQKSPKLLFKPTDPQVIGFVPLYGVTKDMKISAVYEVRANEAGPPLGTTAGNVLEMSGDARMLWGGFGLAPLEPGDYLMRVIVSVDGQEAGVVTRTLRKLQ